ncbi:hypothetical protein [Actinomadura sp. NBRC 104412]|uniref:hypothetical protein n=1 Tax=Actinomadura sp. NBRC 104412 TaxID=3032203 RepID=UPI0025539B3E|nr:hypothetical protein [Actinomadura sp. NBRC 104412]
MGAGISDDGAADSARAVVLRGGLDLAVMLREPGLLAPEPPVPDVLRVPELRVPLRELVLRDAVLRVPVLRVPVLRARVPVLRAREVVPRDVVPRVPVLLDVPRVPPERDVVLLVLRPVAGADVVMALAAAFIARDASVIALVAVVMAFVMAVMALAEEVALVATDLILVAADLASLAALVTLVAAALELRLCAADVRLVPERLVPVLDLLVLDRLVPDRLDVLARLVVPVDLDEVPVLRRTVVRGAVAVCAALVVFLAFLVPVVRAAVPRPDAVRDVLCVGTDLPPRDDQLRGDYSTDRDGLHTFRRSRIRRPPDARPS